MRHIVACAACPPPPPANLVQTVHSFVDASCPYNASIGAVPNLITVIAHNKNFYMYCYQSETATNSDVQHSGVTNFDYLLRENSVPY